MRLLNEIRNYMGNYHVKSGVYHYYRREFTQAVAYLRKALADEASLSEGDRVNARTHLTLALKGLGEKLAADGDLAAGVEQLRLASEVDPGYPDIHYEMARMLEGVERHEEAIEAYRREIDRHPRYLDAHVALGDCLLGRGRHEEAEEILRRAAELKLDTVRRPFEQGLRRLHEGDVAAARGSFHEAFRSIPQLSREYLSKALAQLRAEQYEHALENLDRALALNPKYPDLHNFRGIVLCELERFDEALAAFRRSAELCPGHLVPRLNLAFTLLRAELTDEAAAELESILRQDPDEPVARARLEELRAQRGADRRGQAARP